MPFEILDGVAFYETGYTRKGHFKPYKEGGTITLFGKRYKTHRAIAYAKATPKQRARFSGYDAHHLQGRKVPLTWSNVQLLTAAAHRKL